MHSQIPSRQARSSRLSPLSLPPPRYVRNPYPLTSSLAQTEPRQTHAMRYLQTPRFMKNHQEESSLASFEEVFVSVAPYFLLTAKKSGRDFQRSSGVTKIIPNPTWNGKVRRAECPAEPVSWLLLISDSTSGLSLPLLCRHRIHFGPGMHAMQGTCKPQ